MSVTASALRELHRIHQQLTDLRERLDRGPKQIKARQANVAQAEERLAKAQAELKASRVAADQKQLLLKSSEAKIIDLKAKLNAASSNREYQALKDQIAADQMAGSVLSDEILEALEKIDEQRKSIGQFEEQVVKAKEELTKVQNTIREHESSLKTDVARLETDLKEAEKGLPADFRQSYDRIVKARGEDALAKVEGDVCGGCYYQLTANQVSELTMSRAIFCKSCGRLLYLPEDRTPGRKPEST